MSEHSSLPWNVRPVPSETLTGRKRLSYQIRGDRFGSGVPTADGENNEICFISPHKKAEANAEFIVHAANSHKELLAVAKAIRDCRPEYDTAEETEQLKTRLALAIARAEEGKA